MHKYLCKRILFLEKCEPQITKQEREGWFGFGCENDLLISDSHSLCYRQGKTGDSSLTPWKRLLGLKWKNTLGIEYIWFEDKHKHGMGKTALNIDLL